MASEETMLQLRQQVKHNNDELQSMISGLGKWEEEMKYKEKLKRDKQIYESGAAPDPPELPPVRGGGNKLVTEVDQNKTQHSSQKKQKTSHKPSKFDKGKKPEHKKKTEKIKSYDYAAWDKFDVDEAMKDCDSRDEDSDSCCSEDDGSENLWERAKVDAEQKRQQAVMHKDKGNEQFKLGKYDLAIESYGKAMLCDSVNAIFPANRAQAYIKLQKYHMAEEDCTLALSVDPTYAKAQFRRGVARLELAKQKMKVDNAENKFRMARDDFVTVLKYDANNRQARENLTFIKGVLDEYKTEKTVIAKNEYGDNDDIGSVRDGDVIIKAVDKPLECRSMKPLVKVTIEEIGDAPNVGEKLANVNTKSKLTGTENCNSSPTSDNKSNQEASVSVAKHLQEMKLSITTKPNKIPNMPQNSTQFLRDFKLLMRHSEMLSEYIRLLNAEDFPRLFSEFLDKELLHKLLAVFVAYFVPRDHDVYCYLYHLCEVKRFDMVIMFMNKEDVEMLTTLLWHCVKYRNESEVKTLADRYNIQLSK